MTAIRAHAIIAAGSGVAVAVSSLTACDAPMQPSSNIVRGRYQGIGTYAPGLLWARIAARSAIETPGAASPADDEHVIVVMDGQTGEVRECGDYSGACVSLTPWAARLPRGRISPVLVTEHLADALRDARSVGRHQP